MSAIWFLEEVRTFDPHNIALMNDSVSSYKAIPHFTAIISRLHFKSYFQALGPETLWAVSCGVVDLDGFCIGLQERLPVRSALAKR